MYDLNESHGFKLVRKIGIITDFYDYRIGFLTDLITKASKMRIIKCAEYVREVFGIMIYLSPPNNKMDWFLGLFYHP